MKCDSRCRNLETAFDSCHRTKCMTTEKEKKKEERKMTTGYLFSSLVSLPHSFSRQDFITVYVIKSMEKEKEDRTESVTHGISKRRRRQWTNQGIPSSPPAAKKRDENKTISITNLSCDRLAFYSPCFWRFLHWRCNFCLSLCLSLFLSPASLVSCQCILLKCPSPPPLNVYFLLYFLINVTAHSFSFCSTCKSPLHPLH